MMDAPKLWPQSDGVPVSCVEKLKVLNENHVELVQMMRDAFEDAMLMGVGAQAMQEILHRMVNDLAWPQPPGS